MTRLLPLALCVGCGGFVTPPQNVVIGLALSGSTGSVPRLQQDGHVMELTRLRLTGSTLVQSVGLAMPSTTDIALQTVWTQLAEGPLARGDYKQVKLELTEIWLDGTYDAKPFHLESRQTRSRELNASWRVELGTMSTLSLVADPRLWMTKNEGPQGELIDPSSSKADEQLMDRFFESLTAARDDNHDGVEDPARP